MAAPKGNKFAEGNETSGRPPLYKMPEELQSKIDSYFENPNKRKITVGNALLEIPVYTVSGLAHYLGFESRQSFYDYGKKEEFSYIIKRAQLRMEMMYEENLHFNACTGSIFALKNMGWRDKTEIEHSGNTALGVIVIPDERKNGKHQNRLATTARKANGGSDN